MSKPKPLEEAVIIYHGHAIEAQNNNLKHLTSLHKKAPVVYEYINSVYNLVMKSYEDYQKRNNLVDKVEEVFLLCGLKGYREILEYMDSILNNLNNDYEIINKGSDNIITILEILSTSATLHMVKLLGVTNDEQYQEAMSSLFEGIKETLTIISIGGTLDQKFFDEVIIAKQEALAKRYDYVYFFPFDDLKNLYEMNK